jgi:transcriptional regulator with XRE-family HTH domain
MLGELISEIRKEKGLRQVDLASAVDVSIDTVRRWEQGKRNPRTDELRKIAQVLEVDVRLLLGKKNDDLQFSEEVESNVATINKAMMIPVVTKDVSACCGKGSLYSEDVKWEIVGYYPMDPNALLGYTWQTKNFCIIRAEGDSMEPHIHDGDQVLFAKSPDIEIQSGDFAILMWNGRTLIRGVIFPDTKEVILRPTNDTYKDINTWRGDERLCVLGKVLGITPAFKKTPGLW